MTLGNWTRRHWARNHGQEGLHFVSRASMDDDGSIQLRVPTARRPERVRPHNHIVSSFSMLCWLCAGSRTSSGHEQVRIHT